MNDLPFRILIDGACPLCKREGALLMRMDRGKGNLILENIAEPGFDFSRYGLTFDDAMAQIHGVLPDGTVIRGMEVFRRAYRAVGWGWLLAPTQWPLIKPISDRAYMWFARNRMRLTGQKCETGRCEIKQARV